MRQRLTRATDGELRFFPPEARLLGPPDAAPAPTVTVRRADGTDLPGATVVNAAAAIDSFDQAVTAAANAGARRFAVASTDGLKPGRRYVLVKANGDIAVVVVLASDASNVLLRGALPCALAVGDRLRGCELSIGLTAAQTATDPWPYRGPYASPRGSTSPTRILDRTLFRAVWLYSIRGVVQSPSDELFRIVPRLLKSTLEPYELGPYLPVDPSLALRADESPSFAGVMEAAWSDVLDDIESRGVRVDRVMDTDRLRLPHLFKTAELLGGTFGPKWADWKKEQAGEYQRKLDAVLASDDWLDLDDDGVQDQGEKGFTSIRLVR